MPTGRWHVTPFRHAACRRRDDLPLLASQNLLHAETRVSKALCSQHPVTLQALQEVPQSAPELFPLSPQSSPQELSQRLSKSWTCCISYLCHNQSHFWCSVGRADWSCGSWSWDLSGGTGEGHYLLSSCYFMCSEFPPRKLGHSFKNNNKKRKPLIPEIPVG